MKSTQSHTLAVITENATRLETGAYNKQIIKNTQNHTFRWKCVLIHNIRFF